MKIIPSRKQWSNWSLPSKASYLSAVVAVATLLVSITNLAVGSETLRVVMQSTFGEDFSTFDEELEAQIRPKVIEKARSDFYLKPHEAFSAATNNTLACLDMKSELDDEYIAYSQLFAINAYVKLSAPSSRIRRDDLSQYSHSPKEVVHAVLNSVDVSYFRPALSFFRYYRDQIELQQDYVSNLEKAYETLAIPSNGAKRFADPMNLRFEGAKKVLGITSYPHACFQEDFGRVSLENWLLSFWVRRHHDGTYDLVSWALDQALEASSEEWLLSPVTTALFTVMYPPIDGETLQMIGIEK